MSSNLLTICGLHERGPDVVASRPWREILFVADLAELLGMSACAVRRLLLRGDLGPHFKVGRRYAVLKTTFLDFLKSQETTAHARSTPVLTGRAEEFATLLREGKRPQGAKGGKHGKKGVRNRSMA